MITITAKDRQILGTRYARKIRKEGWLPCILITKDAGTKHLTIKKDDAMKMIEQKARLVNLMYQDKTELVYVQDIQFDHINLHPYHIDFMKVEPDDYVKLELSISIKGQPVGVVRDGGILEQLVKKIKVLCKVSQPISQIEVDVSNLEIGQSINIASLKLPEGVKVIDPPNIKVARVKKPAVAKKEEAKTEAAITQPEVIKKPVKEEAVEKKEK